MATLETRIAALEGGTAGADESLRPTVIFLTGVEPDGSESEAVTVTYRDQTWQRQPGESLQDLKQRAAREVKRDTPGQVAIVAARPPR
jgi:hypothetical protein